MMVNYEVTLPKKVKEQSWRLDPRNILPEVRSQGHYSKAFSSYAPSILYLTCHCQVMCLLFE
jgi:hypothetical protein